MPALTTSRWAKEGGSTTRRRRARFNRSGLAQLTLVEHALCPLDTSQSLAGPLLYETCYPYTDKNGHTRFAKVRVASPQGLSAKDEYFLWGLLALTFAQPGQSIEFWATPHYCLRQLGCLEPGVETGGTQYARFRESIDRLADVVYHNERFYDAIRGEFRDRKFGFLKYDLPTDPSSSRAWRIVWDPLFFEFCRATGGKLFFDLKTYRELDYASRRLFLLLHKIFWRRPHSPRFDVRTLAVHTLGFAPTIPMPQLKQKLHRCIQRLMEIGVISPPGSPGVLGLFEKKGKGSYAVQFLRGPYFTRQPATSCATAPADVRQSPLYEPLQTIGFSDGRIRSILRSYSRPLIELWCDITLAKIERDGRESFSNCPQAYFIDNIREASQGRRTPPDWWREDRKRKEDCRQQTDRHEIDARMDQYEAAWKKARADAFKQYVAEEVGRDEYERAVRTLLDVFGRTMPPNAAMERAIEEAERHFITGFRFPDIASWVRDHSRVRDEK